MEEYDPTKEIADKIFDRSKRIFLNLIFFRDPTPPWYRKFYQKCNKLFDKHYKDFIISNNKRTYRANSNIRRYQKNLQHLRFLLEDNPTPEYDKIAYQHFTSRKFNRYLTEVQNLFLEMRGVRERLKPRSFIGRLNYAYESFDMAPRYVKISFFNLLKNSLKGHMNINYDPHHQISPPHFFYFFKVKQRKIRNIRLATPTSQELFQDVEIIPEFNAFLRSLKKQKKRHLYVNLQRRTKSFFSDESKRTSIIEGLEDEFQNCLTVVTLDKDSSFYHQYNNFREHYDPEAFKKDVIEQIVDNKDGYYFFPKMVLDLNLKRFLLSAFDEIYVKYFHLKTVLSVGERVNFIELLHINIVEWLLKSLEFDSINISCKDSIDRAGSMNALLYLFFCRKESKNFEERWPVIALMPAVTVKRRNMLKDRYDIMVSVARRIIQIKN